MRPRAVTAERRHGLSGRDLQPVAHDAGFEFGLPTAIRRKISARTVEVHKTRIMEKLQVRNIGELVRFALAAEKRGG